LEPGTTLEEGLRNGDLAAVVGAAITAPDVVPLLPDPEQAGFDALQKRGLYPINHLVVVRDDLLAQRPGLAADIFDAFGRAKQVYVDRLRTGSLEHPSASDRTYARVMEVTGADPLPYGIAPNRAVLDDLLETAVGQQILRERMPLETLFATATLDLTA
jgi:hypothetical protein